MYNSIANREEFGNLLDESKDHIMGDSRLLQQQLQATIGEDSEAMYTKRAGLMKKRLLSKELVEIRSVSVNQV